MVFGRSRVLVAVAVFGGIAAVGACAADRPPASATPRLEAGAPDANVIPEIQGSFDAGTGAWVVDASLLTYGNKLAVVARRAPDPTIAVCAKPDRGPLAFEHAPIYTDKVDKDGVFTARLYLGNASGAADAGRACTRRVNVLLSFTPPGKTSTRTIDFVAYVPAGGAFVELRQEASDLLAANVTPGRHAITFAVYDEEGGSVGKALSGNPFRFGKDDVAIQTAPGMPHRIGADEDLVIPLTIANSGDTANRVTPLVVFTRPGETAGIEHYEPPLLVVPGTSTYTVRLSRGAREKENVGAGAWLVTVTMFDAAGDRLNSYAGLPLTIGNIDLRFPRPDLPPKFRASEPLKVVFRFDNRGDTADKVSAVVAFTKPGTTASQEFVFAKVVPPGQTTFEVAVEPAARAARAVDKGVWLVTTAAYRSSGEKIRSYTGHYLEIE